MFAAINNVFEAEIPALMSCNPIVYLRVRVADRHTDDVWKNRVRKWTNATIDKTKVNTEKRDWVTSQMFHHFDSLSVQVRSTRSSASMWRLQPTVQPLVGDGVHRLFEIVKNRLKKEIRLVSQASIQWAGSFQAR